MSQVDLRIALWNSNGLLNHYNEIEYFLADSKIDILLATETHATDRTFVKLPGYRTIFANHPSGRAYGGSAVIIKNSLNYIECPPDTCDAIQVAKVDLQFAGERVIIGAVYCRPRFNLQEGDFDNLITSFGSKFIMGGDFNAKHTFWGSRLSNPKGRQFIKSINKNNVEIYSGGSPTYWPTDPAKVPDLIDFFLFKNIPRQMLSIENSNDLSSDHTPVILTCCRALNSKANTKAINYNNFKVNVANKIKIDVRLKSREDIESNVDNLTKFLKEQIDSVTYEMPTLNNSRQYSLEIRQKIQYKRHLRSQWQITRHPAIKKELNRVTKSLKMDLKIARDNENEIIIQSLSPTATTDYSLWKEIKHIKKPTLRREPLLGETGRWIKDDLGKANAFRDHLCTVFAPHDDRTQGGHITEIDNFVASPMPMNRNVAPIEMRELIYQIRRLNPKKSWGPDFFSPRAIKHLPYRALVLILHIFNAILRLGYFPEKWKVARVIMILKPGKDPALAPSYRPISILSVFSKLIERLILARMHSYITAIIPDHQFGFRGGHGTVEQCHRVVDYIKHSFEEKKYCSAVFIDVSQAFDRVWHQGLLYKLKLFFPINIYVLIMSFIKTRSFLVQVGEESSQYGHIYTGVPQGSVLGPLLYIIFTYDLPVIDDGLSGTFADDTAFLCSHKDATEASRRLQVHLNNVYQWCTRWKIKVNSSKSSHISFTLNKSDCPPVSFGGETLPQYNTIKYLGLHLDRRLTFRDHIKAKRKELNIKRKKLYYILNKNSPLSLRNKILLYKVTLKPIWTYCLPLWGLASKSNIQIIQRFQNITLRVCTGALNYISNEDLHRDLSLPTVEEEIRESAKRHRMRLTNHVNDLASNLINTDIQTSRLKKKLFANL